MRMTVLGGCGAWPAAGQACSGYLVEHDGFRVLVDPGYAVVPRLLELMAAEDVDAVLLSHGHPDHCADLNPLLRARVLRVGGGAPPALPVHALPGAADRVLALDEPGTLAGAAALSAFAAGESFEVGPVRVDTWPLPHWVPNAGLRLEAGGRVLAYTGDTGPSAAIVELARAADLFLAEASFAEQVPAAAASHLSSARQAGEAAAAAGAGRLLLTHLLPGTDPDQAEDAARRAWDGELGVARGGVVVELGEV
jgi:ribonuclease BN (tRNA processing enzyme)